jgi:hypothetical protein
MNVFSFLWKVIVKGDKELWHEFLYHYEIAKNKKIQEAKEDYENRMILGNAMLPDNFPGKKESKYYCGSSDESVNCV